MSSRRIVAIAAGFLALTACETTDRAIFVTSTNIGINADATSRAVNIGYDRTEGFIGPNYVEVGTAPQVVGYLQSNLEVLTPQIKQLYATGNAAGFVTDPQDPKQVAEVPPNAIGLRRVMFFGTTSNIGLKVGFAGDLPDSINLGYKRKEVSVIPFRVSDPKRDPTGDTAKDEKDLYTSVLASIEMNQKTTTLTGTGVGIKQFVATGAAAENLAKRKMIRDIFGVQAAEALSLGALDAEAVRKQAGTFGACVTAADGSLNRTRLENILTRAVRDSAISQDNADTLRRADSVASLQTIVIRGVPGAAPALDTYVRANNNLCTT